ncbi:hypothetical protein J2847_004102 [Azospirillum agricola]|uniref:hypothetical protein n=1 Tax=Azospirillum agricola TaxID=1720247 RepID=UPI001AE9363E|nr:hypothetical protein [Azospirillum agricola]MBP2230793.1 hypothetical protein [Azospirillum agricola]
MLKPKTHREMANPQITARFLADYMAASETARRTIIRGCKYRPIARLIQHDEAKATITNFILDETINLSNILERAHQIRNKIAESDFERELFQHNADYIETFASVYDKINLPTAEIGQSDRAQPITLSGTRVTIDFNFRLRRVTRTNKVKVGAASFRYSKGKALPKEVANWQSAFTYGYLNAIGVDESTEVEQALCLTIDAVTGAVHAAPGDSVRCFKNMEAACASIADLWPNIKPPPKAVL